MIAASSLFDQSTLAHLRDCDPVFLRYRTFFSHLDWFCISEHDPFHPPPGPRPHPQTAYVKALLVKVCEGKQYATHLRSFLLEHPLLVLELGFHPVLDPSFPYGFDVERTVPSDRHFRRKQQLLDHCILTDLFHATIAVLQAEIPGLGETIAVDVKHIYAWVKQNNPRVNLLGRYLADRQPTGDPDCKLGVKKSTNQQQNDGSTKVVKECVWGYGSGVVAATTPDYGDVVLAEYTQPFNENDVTYFLPLHRQATAVLSQYPIYVTADAAFDAWYIYQTPVHHGGIAAIPLNQYGHPTFTRDPDGVPRCPNTNSRSVIQ